MIPYAIPQDDQDLLKECDVETFRSRGCGGQNVNRRETAVRLRHRPTGIVVMCQRERNQLRNKQIALSNLRCRLQNLNRPKIPRIATKMPRSVRQKILEHKKRISWKKKKRQKPSLDD